MREIWLSQSLYSSVVCGGELFVFLESTAVRNALFGFLSSMWASVGAFIAWSYGWVHGDNHTAYCGVNHCTSSHSSSLAAQDEKDHPRDYPIVFLVLDSTKAFNELKQQSIYDTMMEGCRAQ